MIIVHCLLKETWDSIKNERYYGKDLVEQDGFIHCSPINYFWRVVHLFELTLEERLILCIDTDLVENEVKWEDGDLSGRKYPHIYGELNTNAVTNVLPYLRDEHGKFILNDELKELVSKDQLQEFCFERLREAAEEVINPMQLSKESYSGSVAAALESESGRIYRGVCIDTPSSMGFCAEHAAIAAMITAGENKIVRIVSIFKNGKPIPPCGRCREFISKINDDHWQCEIMVDEGIVVTLEELLPYRR